MNIQVNQYQNDWLRLMVRYLIGPAWAAWERSPYLQHYRKLVRNQFDPADVVLRRQQQKLRSLIAFAHGQVPFYQERFAGDAIDWSEFAQSASLTQFPILTKQDLRQHQPQMVAPDYRDQHSAAHWKKTSGSTGTSVKVLVDETAQQFKRACTLRADEWSGWSFGEPVACVWGNPDYLQCGWRGRFRNYLLDRATYLDTLKMDATAMEEFRNRLRKHPPSLLFGHSHSVYLFACYCDAQGGAGFSPRGIISTAMVLHEWERQVIERVFECKVTNRYGCEEVSLIACECDQHQGLHINADGIYLEILRPDGTPCEPGEVGAIVVTDLVNRAMPIIRYQVGDMGAFAKRPCPCGRGLPLLEKIEGRIADYVTTASGRMISGISLTENFAMLVPGLAQLQIVQESLEHFVFRVVRGSDWGPASVEAVENLVRERFGPYVKHTFDFVDRIPQEPSGKYRFCISKVANPWSPVTTVQA
jgi:phenylacetate-CoA ligase